MEDNSFLNFTKDDVISKINIDPRLVTAFKNVMKKFQEYFNANGYTKEKNYQEFLEKYLVNSQEKNMRFLVYTPESIQENGCYIKEQNLIQINEILLQESPESLEATLCHEFIHFLVNHEKNNKSSNFLDEALTEMLTQQMYPNSQSYEVQVAMQKFANLLGEKVNNYSKFLKGDIDAKYNSKLNINPNDWNNYLKYIDKYQENFEKGANVISKVQHDENLINAQRQLIKMFIINYIDKKQSISIEEYMDFIKKLNERPLKDDEYINDVIKQLDSVIIKNIAKDNDDLSKFYQQKLDKLKQTIFALKRYGRRNIYEFEFAKRKLLMDDKYEIEGDIINLAIAKSPKEKTIKLFSNDEVLTIKTDEISFQDKGKECIEKINELSSYFKNSQKDISVIKKAAKENSTLLKVEKFVIHTFENKKIREKAIFIAIYEDRIAILNNAVKLGNVKDVVLSKYLGETTKESHKSLRLYKKLDDIDGISYLAMSIEELHDKEIEVLANMLSKSLSTEQLNSIIQEYKNSEDFIDNVNYRVKQEALIIEANKRFTILSEEEKNKLFETVRNNSPKFVLSTKNGVVDVAYLYTDQVAIKGNKEVLYDSKGNGKYDEIFNLITKSAQNVSSNEDSKTKDEKVPLDDEEYLHNATNELEKLQKAYDLYAKRIEELIKTNYNQSALNELLKSKAEIEIHITNIKQKIKATEDKLKEKNESEENEFEKRFNEKFDLQQEHNDNLESLFTEQETIRNLEQDELSHRKLI